MKIPAWCFVKAEMLVGCSVREWYKINGNNGRLFSLKKKKEEEGNTRENGVGS